MIKDAMAPTPFQNDRGMALLITLTILTVLITTTLALNRQMRGTVMAIATARDRLTLTQMAAGGVHTAMAMLVEDRYETRIDSVQEDWANADKVNEALADTPLSEGKLSVEIRDELGLIQVNALVNFPKGQYVKGVENDAQYAMWLRLLTLLKANHEAFDELETAAVVDSIIDWLDSGDDDRTFGINSAEADYYKTLDPPYEPRNAPIPHVSDLLRVKGITQALYEGIEEFPGMADFVTPYGMEKANQKEGRRDFTFSGRININTAPLPVIVGLLPGDVNLEYAQLIHDYRVEKDGDVYIHDLSSPTWYQSVPGVPGDLRIEPRLITTSSEVFRIDSTATLRGDEAGVSAVVRRERDSETNKWTCRVLRWETR